MKRMRRWIFAASILIVVSLAALFAMRPWRTCALLAGREYFSRTTEIMMPLRDHCTTVNEAPPDGFMTIVEMQRASYGLELQRVAVCRSERQWPQGEPEFTQAAFSDQTQEQWLPLYLGCCSYQFRRHVTVVATQRSGSGSVVLMAALVQSRWRYLRFLRWHCDEKLARWL
jgi:hypothetical protein